MKRLTFTRACAVALLLASALQWTPAAAAGARKPGNADGAQVSQVIAAFVAAANKGDEHAVAAAFAEHAAIVYNVPPYRWIGAGEIKRFTADLARGRAQQAATDVVLTVNPNKAMFLGGSHAYVSVPATYAYKQQGRPVTEDGVLVFVLDKIAGAWKITSLTWGIVR
ncbi:MAG: nuclear transport factor 2 family protein [Candidatus Eremiobacteraeota bacterium]|nr:nuclear transport factor 2 family protein [Candidatus Eremiobacteraeota bacterium]